MPLNCTRAIVLGLLGLAACEGAESGVFITDHLVIEPSDSDLICRGTLEDMEVQTMRVAKTLGVEVPYPIQVDYGGLAVKEQCDSSRFPVGGCAQGLDEDTNVAAQPSSIYHELVHAVRLVNGRRGPAFFEEGIAEVLSASWPLFYYTEIWADGVELGPKELAALPRSEFQPAHYFIAGHFTSWLILTRGEEVVANFLNDDELASDASAAFARHFGLSLDDADAAWRSSSNARYIWGYDCEPRYALTWDGPTLEFDGKIDCSTSNTTGPINDIMSTRVHCFTLDQPGTVRVELIAPGGLAEFVCRGDITDSPLSFEYFRTLQVPAGEAMELPFEQCAWRLAVKTDVAEPGDFSLRLTRL